MSAILSRAWLRGLGPAEAASQSMLRSEEKSRLPSPGYRQPSESCGYPRPHCQSTGHPPCPQSCEQGHAAGGKILRALLDRKGGGSSTTRSAPQKGPFWYADICCRPQAPPLYKIAASHGSHAPVCAGPFFASFLFEIYVRREAGYIRQLCRLPCRLFQTIWLSQVPLLLS